MQTLAGLTGRTSGMVVYRKPSEWISLEFPAGWSGVAVVRVIEVLRRRAVRLLVLADNAVRLRRGRDFATGGGFVLKRGESEELVFACPGLPEPSRVEVCPVFVGSARCRLVTRASHRSIAVDRGEVYVAKSAEEAEMSSRLRAAAEGVE